MGFIVAIDGTAIRSASTMATAIRCLVMDVFDPETCSTMADDPEEPGRAIDPSETSFVISSTIAPDFRITVSPAERPAPVSIDGAGRRVLDLANRITPESAAEVIERAIRVGPKRAMELLAAFERGDKLICDGVYWPRLIADLGMSAEEATRRLVGNWPAGDGPEPGERGALRDVIDLAHRIGLPWAVKALEATIERAESVGWSDDDSADGD